MSPSFRLDPISSGTESREEVEAAQAVTDAKNATTPHQEMRKAGKSDPAITRIPAQKGSKLGKQRTGPRQPLHTASAIPCPPAKASDSETCRMRASKALGCRDTHMCATRHRHLHHSESQDDPKPRRHAFSLFCVRYVAVALNTKSSRASAEQMDSSTIECQKHFWS